MGLPPKYLGRDFIIDASLVKYSITSLGHLQVIGREAPILCVTTTDMDSHTDLDDYRAYQAKLRSIEKDQHMEEQLLLWRKKLSILFPWIRKRGKLDAGTEKPSPLDIVGKSPKFYPKQSFGE